ncbi:Ca2+-binding RTX toxin-like protein, partial [Rhodopseudomonas julia]|nr:Ca2+-binding RTX toxin-like protein [Rhodopseudomonas julia]
MILVKEGATVDISGVTVDGKGHEVYEAIRTHGDLSVTESAFDEIHYSTYLGTAVAARGDNAVLDVSDSTFSNIGRIGAYYGEKATGSFEGNTYTGKGDVDGLDYGVEVESGAVASITDNSFTKITGVASTDKSGSAAILVTTYFGDGSEATITGNSFEGFSLGVAVGYLGDDTSKVTFGDGNTFTDVGEAGVQIVGDSEVSNVSAISGDGATVDWAAGEDANVLSGSGLSDTLTGGAGDDNLTGGAGDDVALFGGNRDDYTITQTKNGSYTVTDTNDADGNDGTDTLTGVEGLRFGSDTITYELDANSPDYAHSKVLFKEDFQDSKATDSFLVNGATSDGVLSVAYDGSDTYGVFTEASDGSSAYTKLGGYSSDFGDGYTVSTKIYLDTDWDAGDGFEVSVAANGQDGAHQRDFVFHVTQDTSTGALLVGANNNAGFGQDENLELQNHATIGSSGWYTFDWNFYENDAGNLEVAMNVYDEDGDFVFSEVRSSAADSIDTEVGGNRYLWFTDISVDGGLKVDDVTLTVPDSGSGGGDSGGGDDGDIGGGTTGGEEDDTLAGTDDADTMSGGGGNDEIEGGGGNDTLFSGEGNDTVDGGDGDDMVFGGAGDDVVTGGGGNDQAYGGTGNDDIDGGDGDDFLGGGEGNDTIIGGGGNDVLFGGKPGLGSDANDAFYAGDGDDQGYAGDGDDIATGGAGAD